MFLEKGQRDDQLKLIGKNPSLIETLLDAPMVVAYMTRESPKGVIDGLNREFLCTHPAINASEHVYLNGLLQEYGEISDYIVSGNCIIFCEAPQKGDKLVVTYRYKI